MKKGKMPVLLLVTGVFCVLGAFFSIAVPVWKAHAAEPMADGAYVSCRCVYMSPVSSQLATSDSGQRYVVEGGTFTIEPRPDSGLLGPAGNAVIVPETWGWQPFPYAGKQWRELLGPLVLQYDAGLVELTYREKLYQPLTEEYFLLRMDGEIWLVRGGEDFLHSIYALVPEEDMGWARWENHMAVSALLPVFPFSFDFDYERVSAVCTQTWLVDFDGEQERDHEMTVGPGGTLYWSPHGEEYLQSPWATIRFTVDTPGGGWHQGTIYITGEEGGTSDSRLYTARLVSSDLVMEQWEPEGTMGTGGVIRLRKMP